MSRTFKKVLVANRGEIALTLLRAPLVPDASADRGDHHIRYALRISDKSFAQSGVLQAGYALNQPLQLLSGRAVPSPCMDIRTDSVILETIKPPEEGDGAILRCYEALGQQGQITLTFPKALRILDCGMNEEGDALLAEGHTVTLQLSPFQVKTLRVMA